MYFVVGNYIVIVFVFNLVGLNIFISFQVLVEVLILEVEFIFFVVYVIWNVFYVVGDLVIIYWVVYNGINVKCLFDFKDGI